MCRFIAGSSRPPLTPSELLLCQCHTAFITTALSHILKSDLVITSPFLFSFKIALAIGGLFVSPY